MSATSIGSIAKASISWTITLSVLMILAGILAIIVPPVAGVAVAILVAWLLVLSGGAHLVFAWHTRTSGAMVWELLLGLLYIAMGAYLLIRPVAALASLTLLLGIYLFAEGVLEFVMAFKLQPLPGTRWLVFDGLITLVLAGMILTTWPSSSEWAIGTLVGVSILFSGISRLGLAMSVHRLAASF